MYLSNLTSVALPVSEIILIGGTPPKLGSPWIRPRSLFSKFFNGLLLGGTLEMYLPNLTSVALPVPEIIGGIPPPKKKWGVPGYAHGPFSRKFLIDVCLDEPCKFNCLI